MKTFIRIDGSAGEVMPIFAREAVEREASSIKADAAAEIVAAKTPLLLPAHAQSSDELVLISNNDVWEAETVQRWPGALKRLNFDDVLASPEVVFKVGGATFGENPVSAKKIVAVTSCPTGIAHTFMAAEGLTEAAKALGYNIRVETQGSVGAGTPLSAQEIADADLVIIAADREVDRSRFTGKKVFSSGTKPAINDGQNLIKQAFEKAKIQTGDASANEAATEEKKSGVATVYKHLMTGISFMLPFVVAGGLLIAISFALGGIDVTNAEGTFAYSLFKIGGTGLGLMVPILAGFIAYSIADRPGIAPGTIGGMLALQLSSGFLGGIVAGFIAGYAVLFLVKYLKMPKSLQGLMPVLVLPLLGTIITGLLMVYVIGTPVAFVFEHLQQWLKGLQGANAFAVGLLLGGMMALDMGGPVNKAAYGTSVALVGSGIYGPMAATMIAGMTPPMALALASWLFPHRFTEDERNSKLSTFILGLAFISEGAIPFAARDPLRVIPSLVIGSAVAGGIAMGVGTGFKAPHGGLFAILIPGVTVNSHFSGYIIPIATVLLALAAGTIISALIVGVWKKPVQKPAAA